MLASANHTEAHPVSPAIWALTLAVASAEDIESRGLRLVVETAEARLGPAPGRRRRDARGRIARAISGQRVSSRCESTSLTPSTLRVVSTAR